MYEKWPNALELPLGQEEGSREAQSKEKSERVGRRTTLPEGELCSPRDAELCTKMCRIRGSTSLCFQCCDVLHEETS